MLAAKALHGLRAKFVKTVVKFLVEERTIRETDTNLWHRSIIA